MMACCASPAAITTLAICLLLGAVAAADAEGGKTCVLFASTSRSASTALATTALQLPRSVGILEPYYHLSQNDTSVVSQFDDLFACLTLKTHPRSMHWDYMCRYEPFLAQRPHLCSNPVKNSPVLYQHCREASIVVVKVIRLWLNTHISFPAECSRRKLITIARHPWLVARSAYALGWIHHSKPFKAVTFADTAYLLAHGAKTICSRAWETITAMQAYAASDPTAQLLELDTTDPASTSRHVDTLAEFILGETISQTLSDRLHSHSKQSWASFGKPQAYLLDRLPAHLEQEAKQHAMAFPACQHVLKHLESLQ
eukprot:m.21607 g.21607  ORF g.21607 m.21607 type:complete len:313 (-) comp9145_c0_seq2:107-1045(-)